LPILETFSHTNSHTEVWDWIKLAPENTFLFDVIVVFIYIVAQMDNLNFTGNNG